MKKQVIILVAFAAFFLAGCAEEKISPVSSENNTSQIEEIPSDVRTLLDQYTVEEEIDISEIAQVPADLDNSMLSDSMYDFYIVTFLWGNLPHNFSATDLITDWSGSLSVNGPSKVFALHPIDFEPDQDSLIPENHPNGEMWASSTQNDFDGIMFLVLYDKLTPTFAPQILTFDTDPITLRFDFRQLVHMQAFYRVDSVNSVAVISQKIRPRICPEGYFAGRWVKADSSHSNGRFEGLWFTHARDTVGYLNGRFWTDDEGQGLLEGVVSGYYTDQVIAKLHGVWAYDDNRLCPTCGVGHGQFKGRFKFLERDANGYFRGEFGNYELPPNDRVMPFRGRWHLDCVDIVTDDLPSSS